MITTDLLHTVLSVEAIVVLTAVAAVFVHALWLQWQTKRDGPRVVRGRRALAELLERASQEEPAPAELARLPRRLRVRLVEDAAAGLTRGDGVAIATAAMKLDLLRQERRRCRSLWWWRRARAIHLLTMWGDADVDVELLSDRNAVVRSRAIEWAGGHPRAELVERLLALLGDETLLCRWVAQDALLRAGAVATEPIRDQLERASGRELELVLALAARRSDATFEAVALRLAGNKEPPIRARAVAVLGAMGGAAGAAALVGRLADDSPEVRAAAARGLGRLGHWPASTAIAALLSDPVWDVRLAAAEALAHMGAPGALLLGHHSRGPDGDAAQVARYALDVARLRRTSEADLNRIP